MNVHDTTSSLAPMRLTFAATSKHEARQAPIGKVWASAGEWSVTPGVKRKAYHYETVAYGSVAEVRKDLRRRIKSGNWTIISGTPHPKLEPGKLYARVKEHFHDVPNRLLTFDFDGFAPEPGEDLSGAEAFSGDAVVDTLCGRLEAAGVHSLANAPFILLATASTGFQVNAKGLPADGCARFRVIYELSTALTLDDRKAIAVALNALPGFSCVDVNVYTVEHHVFLSRAVLPEGMTDPIMDPVVHYDAGEGSKVTCVDVTALAAELAVGIAGSRKSPADGAEEPVGGQEAKPERSDIQTLERLLMGPDAPLRNDKVEHYADYVNVIQWVHGATGGSAEGLDLVTRWGADRAHDADDDPVSKWATIKAPFGGANSLWKMARQMDPIGAAKLAFDPIPEPDPDSPDPVIPPDPGTKFKLVPYAEIDFDLTYEDLIREVLPAQGLALLFGAPKAFKSFVAMDMALHVAAAWDWAGRKTRHGPVVYIAAENARGTRKRKVGFQLKHKDRLPDELPFYLIETAPNLGTEKHDLQALVASVKATTPKPALIVVDTLAQTLSGGDENGTGMAIFVGACTALAQYFGCCVLAVHHPPLGDDKRPRGHTSLRGGLDANLLVERTEHTMTTTVTVEKLKDDEDGARIIIHMERVVIGYTPDLHAISTLVVAGHENGGRVGQTAAAKTKGRPPRNQSLFMQAATEAIIEAGESLHPEIDAFAVRAVHDEEIRTRYSARLAEENTQPDEDEAKIRERARKAFKRAMLSALNAKDLMAKEIDGRRMVWEP